MIFRSTVRGQLGRQGGTELVLESAEPDLRELPQDEFLKRFPAGGYRFLGRGLEREIFYGTASLGHSLANGPNLVAPLQSSDRLPADDVTVFWEGVNDPVGSTIIGYQVLAIEAGGNLTLSSSFFTTAR